MEQICENIEYYTARICHGWGNQHDNLAGLENDLELLKGNIIKEDIKDLKDGAIEYFTSHDDKKTLRVALIKLDALTNAISNYIDQFKSVEGKDNEVKSLESLYEVELELYSRRINELQRTTRKKGGLFSDCCGQGGNVDDKDEITYLGENDKVLNYTNRINTTKLNNDGFYPKL